MPAEIVDLNEKRLEKLGPGQRVRELMRIPAKRRFELILESPDAERTMAALDVNDFFHFLQDIGPDDSLPMLALASVEQINHLFDIDWWRKDSLEPAKALTWLDRLNRASERKLVEWLYNADFDLLVALFKQWISVDVVPEDIDLVEARDQLPPKTLDDHFFWESRYPQYEDLINGLLSIMFEINYGFFKELMNSILYAVTVEAEEQAYHFHRARLSEHSVPELEEALEIYRAIRPNEFTLKRVIGTGGEGDRPPSFALALVQEGDLLGRVLRQVQDFDLADTLQLELASLSNKVVVADQVSPDNAEALRGAVEKALAYTNLGLEIRSEGIVEKAAEVIRNTFLEHLFRLAQAEVAQVRGRLQKVVRTGWLARSPSGIKILDGEWFDAAEELLRKTPRILKLPTGEPTPGAIPRFDYFKTPQDIGRGKYIVDVITGAGGIYSALGKDPRDLEPLLWPEALVQSLEDITLGVMVFTAAANLLTKGNWTVDPLPAGSWPDDFSKLQPAELDRVVMDWVYKQISEQGERNLAEAYLAPILRDYDFEMRSFSSANPPEPQMVKFFLFRE